MSYTVQEVAKLSGVTVKTLHHYHKIGLLMPKRVDDNGYRYYGDQELKRLQQILFYRELDFPLKKIKDLLDQQTDRLSCLLEQHFLLKEKERRLVGILRTLEETIRHEKEEIPMRKDKMFSGLNETEWKEAMKEQNEYLQKNYGYEIDSSEIHADTMNEKANEAIEFMSFMASALRNGISVNDKRVRDAVEKHIRFLQKDMDMDAKGFLAQARFFIMDDFHRKQMEAQQTGLSYYLFCAAENYASG